MPQILLLELAKENAHARRVYVVREIVDRYNALLKLYLWLLLLLLLRGCLWLLRALEVCDLYRARPSVRWVRKSWLFLLLGLFCLHSHPLHLIVTRRSQCGNSTSLPYRQARSRGRCHLGKLFSTYALLYLGASP